MEDEEQEQTQAQQVEKFKQGMENKLTDVMILASWATMKKNGKRDKRCRGLKRKASSKCCVYCMSHEGTYTSEQVDDGAMGGRHEACKCKVMPVFDYVSADIRAKMNEAGIRNDILRENNDAKRFKTSLNFAKASNKHGGYVDSHSVKELKEYKKFLSKDGMCGVAIKTDGDITCVFKNENAGYGGAVYDLIITARENGGVKMDCYGKDLVNLYEKCGFEPVARVKFDPQYVTDELLLKEKPDVFFMKKTEKSSLEVIDDIRLKKTKLSEIEDLEKLPVFDYEKACLYRDNMLK